MSKFELAIQSLDASGCSQQSLGINSITCSGFGLPPSSGYGFLTSKPQGVLISTTAPYGVTITASIMEGGYMDNIFSGTVVPIINDPSLFFMIAKDGLYYKMVQVRNT